MAFGLIGRLPSIVVRRILHATALGRAAAVLALWPAALLLAVPAGAGAAVAPPAPTVPAKQVLYRDHPDGMYLLGGRWLYRPDPTDAGVARGFQAQADATGWKVVSVPSSFNAGDLSDASMAGSVGWYRKDFRAPGGRPFRWAFRFESVNYRAQVWLNGRQLGRHQGAYLPFEIPTGIVKEKGVNRLVVRVDSRRLETDIPSKLGQGWWNAGGILREVYLRRVGRLDMESVKALPAVRGRRATVTVSVKVRNRSGRRRGGIRGIIERPGAKMGLHFKRARKAVPGFGAHVYTAKVKLKHPRLWSPTRPRLYALHVSVGPLNDPDQRYNTHFGVRGFRVTGGGRVLLNGRPINLRGASMHEWDRVTGGAVQPARRAQDFSLLRRLGANFTRSHYPLHPWTLEQADRHGILVWDEIPFYQLKQRNVKLPFVRDKGLVMLRGMINRDANHASVMTYSIANELAPYLSGGAINYINRSVRTIRQLDPTRLAAMDINGYPPVPTQTAYRKLDALGLNTYFGWYQGMNGSTRNRGGLPFYLNQMHAQYPHTALFVTEMGAEASRNGPVTEKGTFQFQSNWIAYVLGQIQSKPFVNGALYWTLREFAVKPGWAGGNPIPNPPIHQKGLVTLRGNLKPAFKVVAQIYARTPWFR